MGEERTTLLKRAMEAGGQLKVKSALYPVLWLCGILTVPGMIAATLGDLPFLFQIVAVAPVAFALGGFLFLLLFDREKLQSEEYQIRSRSLEIVEQSNGLIIKDPSKIVLTENPDILGEIDE